MGGHAASRRPLALYNEMTELALVIIGDVLFGVDLWDDASRDGQRPRRRRCAVLKKRVSALAPLPLWVPTGDNRRFNSAMRTLNDRIWAHHRAEPPKQGDGGAQLPGDADGRRGTRRPARA